MSLEPDQQWVVDAIAEVGERFGLKVRRNLLDAIWGWTCLVAFSGREMPERAFTVHVEMNPREFFAYILHPGERLSQSLAPALGDESFPERGMQPARLGDPQGIEVATAMVERELARLLPTLSV